MRLSIISAGGFGRPSGAISSRVYASCSHAFRALLGTHIPVWIVIVPLNRRRRRGRGGLSRGGDRSVLHGTRDLQPELLCGASANSREQTHHAFEGDFVLGIHDPLQEGGDVLDVGLL